MTEQAQVPTTLRFPHSLGDQSLGELVAWGLAAASVGAAAIHFAVLGEHYREAWYFGAFFAVIAWAQLAWAVAIVMRPSRRVLWAGVALQGMVVAVYVWSRTTGLPIGPEPWSPESYAFLDVFCTLLEVVAGAGAAFLVFRPLPRPVGRGLRAVALSGLVVGVAAVTSVALAVAPGEMMDMDMTSASATHMGAMAGGAGGSIGTSMDMSGSSSSTTMGPMTNGAGSATMPGMANMTGAGADTTMPGMGDMGGTSPSMPGMGDGSLSLATISPAGAIVWPMMAMHMGPGMAMAGPACTTTPSAAQQQAAVAFVNNTVAATTKYRSLAAAKADGFVPVTPAGASIVHYINWSRMAADQSPSDVLVPSAVQSLVYANTSTGPRLVAAMYLMPNGSVATPPDPGGCLTQWHLHTNLCFNSSNQVVGVTDAQGTCPTGSVNRNTQPMIHVWVAPIAGGPLMVDAPDGQVIAAAMKLPAADPPPVRA